MAGRYTHTTETRIEAERLFDAGFGYVSVGKLLGLSPGTCRVWHDGYKQGRLLGLGVMRTHKHFSAEEKVAAVEKFLAGSLKTEVMAQFGIGTRAVLNKWVVIYREQGVEGLQAKRRGRPKRDAGSLPETDAQLINRLEMEVAVLKKLIALESRAQAALLAKRKQSGR